jgi:16S rRNA (guanine(966)-N(2))-methyltransferase RsmD
VPVRVIAGKYRRQLLRSTPSPKVRPTARRLREALFELLADRIEDARFLDLCAGSGAVGIEALSRGARHVTFVDHSPKICSLIAHNLVLCGVREDQAELLASDAVRFLRREAAERRPGWDIAFFDPPYATDYEAVLSFFGTRRLLRRGGGVLVAEHYCENDLEDAYGSLRRRHVLRQGESCLSFYERV